MTYIDDTHSPGAIRPPASGRGHTASLENVTRLVRSAGLMDRRPGFYVYKIATNAILLGAGWAAFALLGDSWWQMVVAVFLAFCFGQTDLVGHDAGHRQIYNTRKPSDVIGYIHGNLLTGVSFGWWVGHHTKHHNFPNHLSLDPDIFRRQVIFDTSQRGKLTTPTARFIVRHQAWMFYVVIMLEGLRMHMSGFVAARKGALKKYKAMDLTTLSVHLVVYLGVVFMVLPPVKAVLFIVIHQALFGFYMGLLFAPNHKGLEVRDGEKEELDWITRQVVTSRNILPNRVTDFFYGGLNYQIEHHLFPSMPRVNLRRAQPMIKRYCLRHQLPYVEVSLMRSYLDVSQYLDEISDQVHVLEQEAPLSA